MALTSLIPEIWSARFLANLDKFHVFGRAINYDYQPDVPPGDTVKIPSLGDVTVTDYTKDTNHAAAQVLTATTQDLVVDQQKMFNFLVDSIDKAQAKPNVMDKAMMRAAYAMSQTVDAFISSFHGDATTKYGTTAVPVTPTDSDVYGRLTTMMKDLDKLNVPSYGRYIIMGPAGIKLLKDSGEAWDTQEGDLIRIKGQFAEDGVLPDGYKGTMAGFDVWMSNNTYTGGTGVTETWYAGHRMAIGFVESFTEIKAYEPELRFGEAVKGLHVYGAKVTQPKALAVTYTDLT